MPGPTVQNLHADLMSTMRTMLELMKKDRFDEVAEQMAGWPAPIAALLMSFIAQSLPPGMKDYQLKLDKEIIKLALVAYPEPEDFPGISETKH